MSEIAAGASSSVNRASHYETASKKAIQNAKKTEQKIKTQASEKTNRFSDKLNSYNKLDNGRFGPHINPVYKMDLNKQRAFEEQRAKIESSIKNGKKNIDSLIKSGDLNDSHIKKILKENRDLKDVDISKKLRDNRRVITNAKDDINSLPESLQKNDSKNGDTNGTDFALKKASKDMEIQIISMFFTLIDEAKRQNPDHEFAGGFGEELFRGEYLSEMVRASSGDELGDIGQAIYRDLSRHNSK